MTSADHQPNDDTPRYVVGIGASAEGLESAGGLEAVAASKLWTARQAVDHQLLATYDRLLDRYMPPSILVSAKHEVVHAFGGAEKYLRYPGGRVTNFILDLLEDQLRSPVGWGLQHASQSGEPVSYPDLLFQSNEGQVRLLIAIEPIFEPLGSIENLLIVFKEAVGLSTDPPKLAEISDVDLMLRDRAITATNSGIVIVDAIVDDLPIVFANHGFEKITGYSKSSVIGKNCRFLQGPGTDREKVAVIREAISQRQDCRVILLNYRKDGQPFWNDLHLTPVFDDAGAVTHFVGIQRDVSDQVDNERAIRASEANYRSTYENAAVGIAQLNASGRWIRVNKCLCEIVGYNQDELLGMTFHQLTDPEDLLEDVSRFASLVNGEVTGYSCESRYHHRDGHIVWVLLTTSRRLNDEGQPAGYLAVIQDISDRKQAEMDLQKAQRMAASANRAKSNFVANMSHELRTPTTAILGFADMLADAIVVPEQLQKLQTLKRNGEYLLRLLDDILDLSKIESRRSKHDTAPCDLMRLIDEVEVLMQGRASQLGNRLSFHFPTQLPRTIYTSTAQVRRILVNLIANTLRFTNQAAVSVAIRYREDQCGDEEGQPCLEVEVAETCIPSSDEQQARSFVPFTQADPKIVQRFAGKGSGLSITKRLVTALGGTIAVACDKENSHTFLIRLPVGEAGDMELIPREIGMPPSQAVGDAGQLRCIEGRILVADDRRDIWQVTKYFLERCGAEVAVAEDGRQAVDAVRVAAQQGEPFDLVLLDMQMPVMNGLEAVRELRGDGFSLPIIALTADAMKGERQKCIAAGCNDYLTKPIDVMVLTETVVKHLGERV